MQTTKIKLKNKKTQGRLGKSPLNWIICTYLIVHSLIFLFMIFWGISTSVKTIDDFMGYISSNGYVEPNKIWLPRGKFSEWGWTNYVNVFKNFYVTVTSKEFGQKQIWMEGMILNSLLYAGVTAIIQTFSHCWVAYLCQRFKYKFSGFLFNMIIIVNIIPIIGTNASMLQVFKKLNIYDTFFSFYLMKFTFTSMPFFVFYASFKVIPKDFEEAAYLDGASDFKVFFTILLPMVSGTFLIFIITGFMGYWNDYMTPLIFLPTHPTFAYGVYTLVNTTINSFNRTPMRMATCVVLVVPIIILFLIFREKMMTSVRIGGMKE